MLMLGLGTSPVLPSSEASRPPEVIVAEAQRLARSGDFAAAERIVDEALAAGSSGAPGMRPLEAERQRLAAMRMDYPLTREMLRAAVRQALSDFDAREFEQWLREGRFDSRRIDGETRYSASSVSNLFFRYPALESRRRQPRPRENLARAYLRDAREITRAAADSGTPFVLPRRFHVRMRLKVTPGSVTAGDVVRAWLPVPRRFPQQTDIEIGEGRPSVAAVAPEESRCRSVLLEATAAPDGSAEFELNCTYTAWGVRFDLDSRGGEVAGGSAELAEYLREAPHIVFTPEMRRLEARLSGTRRDPVARARRFYEWISDNIVYSYAPEYGTVENLGAACLRDQRGDCGQAAFLFMTLCRIAGIPARWQSGWSLFPGAQTIHDWCEVHLPPWGWVPVDPYMGIFAARYAEGLDEKERAELRDFYFGGLTAYRMAANSDHNQELWPARTSVRSDPVDFQRGEVEADGRNLYFDRFRTELEWREAGGIAMGSRPSEAPGAMTGASYPLAAELMNRALTGTNAYARLVELCDTFGPRFSGTTNLEAAIDWVLDRLREDGFENVRGQEVLVPRWVRGEESLEELAPRSRNMPVLGLGGSVGTPPGGITAPVLVVTNFAELEQRADAARGRIVVFHAPFESYAAIVRYRTQGAVAAARAGALASLVRSATPFSLQTPHTGGMRYEEGVPRIPHAAITVEDGERLLRLQRRGIAPVLRLRMDARTLPDVTSRNVIAELPGTEPGIIVVGGHIDSWDVAPGALDDAGGCIAAWEALRLLRTAGYRPRRTLRLVLWTNEENGLRGARAYASGHESQLPDHIVAIESDWGIGPLRGFAFTGSERANGQLRAVLPLLEPVGAAGLKAGAGGSDLGPLLQRGVPVMDLWTDRADYFWFHHSPADTVDKVDPAELNRCVAALALMLYALSEMPEPLAR